MTEGSHNDCTQQALHLFFEDYSTEHADELANTCVLLICEALRDAVLLWDPAAGTLRPEHNRGRLSINAVAVHLQCKFLLRLMRTSDLPIHAVCEAVCANNPGLDLSADAFEAWIQT